MEVATNICGALLSSYCAQSAVQRLGSLGNHAHRGLFDLATATPHRCQLQHFGHLQNNPRQLEVPSISCVMARLGRSRQHSS